MPVELNAVFGSKTSLNDQQSINTNMIIFGVVLAVFCLLARNLFEWHSTIRAYDKLLAKLRVQHSLPDNLISKLYLHAQRASISDLVKSMQYLDDKRALNKEIIEKLTNFNAIKLWEALSLFNNKGNCSDRDCIKLLEYGQKNPAGMAKAIIRFKRSEVSIELFWEILSKIDDPKCFADIALALMKCKRRPISGDEVLTLLCKPSAKETNIVIKTLSCLSEELRTIENVNLIVKLESKKRLALQNFLVSLSGKKLSLSQEQLNQLIDGGVNFNPFTLNLVQYFKDKVIKQDDIDELFKKPWLLTHDAYETLWRRFPLNSLDSECLRTICRAVDDTNNSGETLTIAHFDHKFNIQYGEHKFFVLSKEEKEAFENRAFGAYAVELAALKERDVFEESHIPDDYFCSINFQMMTTPVAIKSMDNNGVEIDLNGKKIVVENSFYERNALISWVKSHETSPLTRQAIHVLQRDEWIVPLDDLKENIDTFLVEARSGKYRPAKALSDKMPVSNHSLQAFLG